MVCAHGRTCFGGAGPPNHHIGEKNRIKTTTNRNEILADQTGRFVDCYPGSFVMDAANGYCRYVCNKIIQGNNIMDISDDSRQSDSSVAEDSSEVSSQVEDFYYSSKRLYRDELGKERIPDWWSRQQDIQSWTEYSEGWWSDLQEESRENWKTTTTKRVFTDSDWPLTLTIVDRHEPFMFSTSKIIEEMFAQKEDIINSAIAVKEALRLRVICHDKFIRAGVLSQEEEEYSKRDIDAIYLLWRYHKTAANYTEYWTNYIVQNILITGAPRHLDFRHYTFEGSPLSEEAELLYHKLLNRCGASGIRHIGLPAVWYPAGPDHWIDWNVGWPCICIDKGRCLGMLLYFPDEPEEERFRWEVRLYRVRFSQANRAQIGMELRAKNSELYRSVWDEPDIPEPSQQELQPFELDCQLIDY